MVLLAKKAGGELADYKDVFAWLRSIDPNARYEEAPGVAHYNYESKTLRDSRKLVFTFVDAAGQPTYDEVRIEGINEAGERDKRTFQRRRLPKGRWLETKGSYQYFDLRGENVVWGPNDPTPIEIPKIRFDGTTAKEPHGPYVYTLRGIDSVLYKLPEVRAAASRHDIIFFVEGPKKADALAHRTGLVTTTIAKGANAGITDQMVFDVGGAKSIILLADSDDPGRAAALARAQAFSKTVFDVRIIDLYNDNSKRDIYDWLQERRGASGSDLRGQLTELVNAAAVIRQTGIALDANDLSLERPDRGRSHAAQSRSR
jgi:hypothetical protein